MSKEDCISMSGIVTNKYPAGRFGVKIDDNAHQVDAFLSGKIRQNNIVISVGDRVDIEVSPYDLSKGRITYRHNH